MSSKSVRSLKKDGDKDMVESLGCNLGLDMGSWGMSTWVMIIVIPLLVWLILSVWQPDFVVDIDGMTRTLNNQKLFLWTVIITLIVWAVLYLLYMTM